MALTGTYQRTLDDKQRLAVPKSLREDLVREEERTLFVAPETNRSLSLFSADVFRHRAQRLQQQSGAGRAAVQNYMRLYYSQAEQLEIDSQGRIRLPERLVTFAQLKQEIVLLGVHDHVEIWDKGLWEDFLATHGSEFDELASEAFR